MHAVRRHVTLMIWASQKLNWKANTYSDRRTATACQKWKMKSKDTRLEDMWHWSYEQVKMKLKSKNTRIEEQRQRVENENEEQRPAVGRHVTLMIWASQKWKWIQQRHAVRRHAWFEVTLIIWASQKWNWKANTYVGSKNSGSVSKMKMKSKDMRLEDMWHWSYEQVKNETEEQIHTRIEEQRQCVKNENEEQRHAVRRHVTLIIWASQNETEEQIHTRIEEHRQRVNNEN